MAKCPLNPSSVTKIVGWIIYWVIAYGDGIFCVYFTALYYVASNTTLLTQHNSSKCQENENKWKPCYDAETSKQKPITLNNKCKHKVK